MSQKSLRLIIFALVSVGTMGSPNFVLSATDQELIEEITVSATRAEKSIHEIPMAVTVIESKNIHKGRQKIGLDESLNRSPGIFSQNRYNFAQDLRIAIRGFGARANFGIRGIKIFSDGIPATLADGQSGVDDIDLNILERIEVLRGPSSSLYGSSSGGVINLITQDGPSTPFAETGFTLGAYDQERYFFKAGGQTNQINYYASASKLKYGGYRENSETESTQLNSKIRYNFDSDSHLSLILNLVDSPLANDAGGITLNDVAQDRRQAQVRNVSSNAGEEIDQQRIGLVYQRTLNDESEITVRNYYLWRDFSAFLPIGTHIPFVSDDGVVEFNRFFWGGGIQWNKNSYLFELPYRLVTGIDIDIQKDDRRRYLNEAGQKGALSFDQLEQAQSYGVFFQNELDLTDSITVAAGLRYDHVKLAVDDKYLDNANQSAELQFNKFSPSVSLIWVVQPKHSLYLNFATSFETPTFTELANPARNMTTSLGGFNNVAAQQARSIEVGLKSSFFDNKLYLDIAAFSMKVDDEITSVSNIGNRSFFENADTKRQGIEIYSQLSINENITGTLAYTYSNFKFDYFGETTAYVGNQLPGIPNNYFFAELELSTESGLYFAADIVYSGKLQANNANSISSSASTIVNLRTSYNYSIGSWQIEPTFGINNIFNKDYFSNVRLNGFGGRLFEPGPRRNIYGGLTLHLNF